MKARRFVFAAVLMGFTALPLTGLNVQGGENPENPKYNLIYVPTEDQVIEKMFEMAKLSDKDTIFDLGCGDGRVVCMALKKFPGAKGIGIDLNPKRISECMESIEKYKLADDVQNFRLEFRLGDAIKVPDIERANVIFLYMLPEFMDLLEPIAATKLKPGTRIVSHDYRWHVGNWEPDITLENFQGPNRTHTLYRWTVPVTAENTPPVPTAGPDTTKGKGKLDATKGKTLEIPKGKTK